MKEIIERTIEVARKNNPSLSEEEVRMMVYEDLRDSLKVLMSDVSY